VIKGKISARDGAAKILLEVTKEGAYANLYLKESLSKWDMAKQERGLCTEIVYGTLQNLLLIDFYISSYSSVKQNKISPWIMSVLRIGIYQLLFLDNIPPSAACNESVKLARRQGERAGGFVNAVLRKINKNKENLPSPIGDEMTVLSVLTSVPRWIIELWSDGYGFETAVKLAKSANRRRDTVIRVNTLKTDTASLLKTLKSEGVDSEPVSWLENAVNISYTGDISHLTFFKEGEFLVQDTAAQLCVKALSPEPGQVVMDLCAAPGGKTMLSAQIMQNSGEIHAFDIHSHKLDIINANAKRLGIDIVKGELWDAKSIKGELVGKADRVLCDVPCSGLGIMQKKPEIRFKKKEEIEKLPQLQLSILKAGAQYVKRGGILVYSTCTINRYENDEVVRSFLNEQKDFEPFSIEKTLPEKLKKDANDGGITLLWDRHETDGFFIYRMRRV
jgi:16S rRNA (cytosine967-C5)-methyltransferase